MDRTDVITSLVRFDRPLDELESALRGFEFDSEPLVTLTRRNVADVLRRYLTGQLDAGAVEAWANLVECRDDIAFEPGQEAIVADAIFDLANPELQGPLEAVVPEVLRQISE